MQKSAFLYLPVSTPKLIFLMMAIARTKTRYQIGRTFHQLISPTKLLSIIYSLPWPYFTDFRVNYSFNLSPMKSFKSVICHNLIISSRARVRQFDSLLAAAWPFHSSSCHGSSSCSSELHWEREQLNNLLS